jgi:translation elongation factor EF-4
MIDQASSLESMSALDKDVIAKCYGGSIARGRQVVSPI